MTHLFSSEEPPRTEQQRAWNEWNRSHRLGETDEYTSRLRDHAARLASRAGQRLRILEIGCGTGWLSQALAPYGDVVGVDLSADAIEAARKRCPGGTFICGDFLGVDIEGPFDFAVTADTIAHVADKAAFIERVAALLRPSGTFLLMTQNAFVLLRSSYIQPPPPGQYRRWPTRAELHALLAPSFDIMDTTSVAPGGGNVGLMRVANSRYVWGVLWHSIGRERAMALYERLLLGRELSILARRH